MIGSGVQITGKPSGGLSGAEYDRHNDNPIHNITAVQITIPKNKIVR